MDIDQSLVNELRARARRNENPCSMIPAIASHLGLKEQDSRFACIRYFMAAFGLSIGEVSVIGAAPAFSGRPRNTEEIDSNLWKSMNLHRGTWDL